MSKQCTTCDKYDMCRLAGDDGIDCCEHWSGWHDLLKNPYDMPEEHDSVFVKFYGTEKWKDSMFRKLSYPVLVCFEFEDGTRCVWQSKSVDGVFRNELTIAKMKPVAWRHMPEYEVKDETYD